MLAVAAMVVASTLVKAGVIRAAVDVVAVSGQWQGSNGGLGDDGGGGSYGGLEGGPEPIF